MIKEFETVDDLGEGFKIIQNENGFKFGTDAVLLSDFAVVRAGDRVMDLCTGTAIIPILLCKKTNCNSFSGLEIQEDVCDMAQRSVVLNNLEEKINICCGDLKDIKKLYEANSFSVVTCNPPYMKDLSGKQNESTQKTISRHEIKCTLEDVIVASAYLLGTGGKLFMVHRPSRLAEIFYFMKLYKLEPKRLKLVGEKENPSLVLIEAQKDRKSGLTFA